MLRSRVTAERKTLLSYRLGQGCALCEYMWSRVFLLVISTYRGREAHPRKVYKFAASAFRAPEEWSRARLLLLAAAARCPYRFGQCMSRGGVAYSIPARTYLQRAQPEAHPRKLYKFTASDSTEVRSAITAGIGGGDLEALKP